MEVEDGKVCVVARLEVVKKGDFACHDMVLCPVPGCPFAVGTGMQRDSIPAHFAATTRAATHGEWSVEKSRKPPAKRRRESKPSAGTLQARLANFFLRPAEVAAAEVPMELEEVAREVEPVAVGDDAADTPLPADGEAPAPASRSLLAQLGDVPRLLLSLIREVRRLPAAIIAAQREAEEKKEAATAASRIKGATLAELAEENGLLLEEGWLKCIPCLHHAPRLSGGRSGTQQPGCFNALRRLSELKVDLCKHFQRPSHTAACNAAAEKERQEKAATSAGWNIGRAIYYRACPVDSRYSSCVHSTLPRRTAELLEAMSHISYERMIVLLDGCGINVGTLNHSRKFMASFLPSLHFVFRSRMQRFFAAPVAIFGGRLLPFALMSDKLTVKRITQEAGGVIYMDVTVGELKAQTYRPEKTLYSSRSKVLRRLDTAVAKHTFLA
jgi:hypothetical protein